MSDLRIITNNVPRPVINEYELSAKEREEFDYLDWAAMERGEDSASFFRYRCRLYDIGEFAVIGGPWATFSEESPIRAWHGFLSDSFFSAIVIRWADDEFESVVVGMVLS